LVNTQFHFGDDGNVCGHCYEYLRAHIFIEFFLVKNRKMSNVKSTDFLGVVVDSNLSWEKHIDRTCS
jgi:hypothetical protein